MHVSYGILIGWVGEGGQDEAGSTSEVAQGRGARYARVVQGRGAEQRDTLLHVSQANKKFEPRPITQGLATQGTILTHNTDPADKEPRANISVA